MNRCLAALLLGIAANAPAQAGIITTVAGGGPPPSTSTTSGPMALDSGGNLYLPGEGQIVKVSVTGLVSTIALPAGTGPIKCLATDGASSVYFCDQVNHRVQKIATTGVVSDVATGVATPQSVAVDASGNVFIGDGGGYRILKVSGATVTTVAGNGTAGAPSEGGPATSTSVGTPYAIVLDSAGGFYFSDGARVLHVAAAGMLTRVAGSSLQGPRAVNGGSGLASSFQVTGFTLDGAGNVYIASFFENKVFRIDTSDVIHTFAGVGPGGPFGSFDGDGGPATAAHLFAPWNVVRDAMGNTYIADTRNNRIRKVDPAGNITSLPVGNASGNGDGGQATSAHLGGTLDVAARPGGGMAIADQTTRVRFVDAAGIITSPAVSIPSFPGGVAYDSSGNLYVSDVDGARVLKRDGSGVVTVVAGGNGTGYSGDGGPATSAKLSGPRGLAFDSAGNLYIADTANRRVRRVASNGIITTVAGNGTTIYVEGVAATASGLSPWSVATDASGNLFIGGSADIPADGHRVVKVDGTGIMRTFAGTGAFGGAGEGVPAVSALLRSPLSVAVDPSGNVYVAEANNGRVRVIGPDGLLFTLAGNGTMGFSGDGGPAANAQLAHPMGLSWDSTGALLVADSTNLRIRRIEVADTTPDAFSFPAATGVAVAAVVQSAAVTPTGYAAAAGVTITGGEYSVGCNGTFVSTPGALDSGQSICVRHTSASVNNMDVVTILSLGGRQAPFRSTTIAGPGAVTLGAASLDFGAYSLNTTGPAQDVTLTNTGSVAVTVNSVTTTVDFGVTHDCATLAPGAGCTARVTFTPRSTGVLNGTLTLQNSPGTQTVALAGFGERSLTVHYYRSILRRAPDVQGKNFWEGEATRLTGLGVNINEIWYAMAMSFFFSPEYVALNRNNSEYVADLYNTFFNRPPDPGGSGFWANQLASGMPREVVLASFMFSSEFTSFTRAVFGNTEARAEVDVVMDFYRGLLARFPESTGLAHWVGRFRAAQCVAGGAGAVGVAIRAEVEAISKEFATGSEYANRNRTNSHYVGDLYNAFLRRGGELSGVQFWINELNANSRTREKARTDFLASAEFQARVSRLISQGCMQ